LPERVGPYSTAIFVVVGNAKSIYSYLINQVESVEARFVEAIRKTVEENVLVKLLKEVKTCKSNIERKEKNAKRQIRENDEQKYTDENQPIYLKKLTELQNELAQIQECLLLLKDFIHKPSPILAARLIASKDVDDPLKKHLDEYHDLTLQLTEIDKSIQTLNKKKVLKKFGFSRRGIIVSVLLATFALLVVLTFLILGMNTFSSEDAFSAALTSTLSVITGFLVNLRARKTQFLDASLIEKKVNQMLKLYLDLSKHSGNITPDDELNLQGLNKRINEMGGDDN
jgi:hypothetical protein